MSKVRDRRYASWFWVDKALVDHYGVRLGPSGLAVYMLLARCANEQGQAIPSLRYIADKIGMSRRGVINTLKKLVDEKLVAIASRTDTYGDRASNIYTLLPVGGGELSALPSELDARGVVNSVHGGGELSAPRTRTMEQEPSEQSPYSPPRDTSGFFEKFWEAYPKKIGKKAALSSWKRQALDKIGDQVLASVHDHQNYCEQWKDGYVCNPATYLNQGRWEDEFEKSKPPRACDHKGAVPVAEDMRDCPRCGQIAESEFVAARGL
jgi:DNA-binding MarR family transcriptional regulator